MYSPSLIEFPTECLRLQERLEQPELELDPGSEEISPLLMNDNASLPFEVHLYGTRVESDWNNGTYFT